MTACSADWHTGYGVEPRPALQGRAGRILLLMQIENSYQEDVRG